jgi:hypothetical protein
MSKYKILQGNDIKCVNYEICERVLPEWWFDMKIDCFCLTCDIFGWKKLEFKDCDEDCAICFMRVKQQMRFPSCSHWFCSKCSKDLLFWNECRYHLNPVQFGCPPCPNGCLNPNNGVQCYCLEYDIIQSKWEAEYPEQFKKWNDNKSVLTKIDSIYGCKQCPLCK